MLIFCKATKKTNLTNVKELFCFLKLFEMMDARNRKIP